MPVPTKMADIPSQTPSACYPTGAEVVGNNMDDYIRANAAITRSTNAISTSTIASAATTDIALSDAERVTVTGTTGITSLGSSGVAGLRREVLFSGALTLTNSANLILPGGSNITTVAGDVLTFRYEGSSVWRLTSTSRQSAAASSEVVTALSISAGAVTINLALGNMFTLTLNQNITSISLTNPPSAGRGQGYTIEVKQDATGGRTISGWPAAMKWSGGTYAPTATANAIDEVSFRTYDQGVTYRGTYAKAYA
jgi:hypothetical protein